MSRVYLDWNAAMMGWVISMSLLCILTAVVVMAAITRGPGPPALGLRASVPASSLVLRAPVRRATADGLPPERRSVERTPAIRVTSLVVGGQRTGLIRVIPA